MLFKLSYLNSNFALNPALKNSPLLDKQHTTATALLEAADNWAFNIDRGNVNAVVFLDLKKAFDTVDRDILLSKMNLYGIQEIAFASLQY